MKPKDKGHTNFYECCDLTEKVYLAVPYNNTTIMLMIDRVMNDAVQKLSPYYLSPDLEFDDGKLIHFRLFDDPLSASLCHSSYGVSRA